MKPDRTFLAVYHEAVRRARISLDKSKNPELSDPDIFDREFAIAIAEQQRAIWENLRSRMGPKTPTGDNREI